MISLPPLGPGRHFVLDTILVDATGPEISRQCADVVTEGTAGAPSAALRAPATLHASCRLQWTFTGQQCASVSDALVAAFKDMTGDDCGSGEKCLYSLGSANATVITGKHETPAKHYKDDLSFHAAQEGADCVVGGFSTSETWYAVLDDGTNYCNLRNLADHTGLAFHEAVSASDCTQLKSANCDKY